MNIFNILINAGYDLMIISYIFGVIATFLSFFRSGINPNIPVVRVEGLKEFVMVLVVSVFWPIIAIISIVSKEDT